MYHADVLFATGLWEETQEPGAGQPAPSGNRAPGKQDTELLSRAINARFNRFHRTLKDFGDIRLLNGRYGPYLVKDKKNFRIPKGTDPEKLTREECIEIIEKSEKTKKS